MEFLAQLEKGRFGSFELKRQIGPNLLKGLLVSLLIHGTVLASPFIYNLFRGPGEVEDEDRVIVLMPLPPLIPNTPDGPKIRIEPPIAPPPKAVVPVPVADEPIVDSTTALMPSPEDWKKHYQHRADSLQGLIGEGGDDRLVVFEAPPLEEEIPAPDVFVAVEVLPAALDNNPQPRFPELAKTAGVGAVVTVNMFVDKNGNVKQWKVMKTTAAGLGFEEEVERVLPEWKFTPAIQSGKPIGVWVAVPFRFKVEK